MESKKVVVAQKIFCEPEDRYYYSFPQDQIDELEAHGIMPLMLASNEEDSAPVVAMPLCIAGKGFDNKQGDLGISQYIVESLIALGLRPVFLSWNMWADQLEYWKPAGIILPGGQYWVRPQYILAPTDMSPKLNFTRFDANIGVLEYAIKNSLPTLGLCAGMQLAAVYFGGKYNSVKVAVPDSTIVHKLPHGTAEHEIKIAKDSELFTILGTESGVVNSRHLITVDLSKTDAFNISATAPDGIIEAIELKKPFASFVGLYQWHAEEDKDGKIFARFAKAII